MIISFDKSKGDSCQNGRFEVKNRVKFLGFGAANQPAEGFVLDLEPGMTISHPAPAPPRIPHRDMQPKDLLETYAYWCHREGRNHHECIWALAELERREEERLDMLQSCGRTQYTYDCEEYDDYDEEYDEDYVYEDDDYDEA